MTPNADTLMAYTEALPPEDLMTLLSNLRSFSATVGVGTCLSVTVKAVQYLSPQSLIEIDRLLPNYQAGLYKNNVVHHLVTLQVQ